MENVIGTFVGKKTQDIIAYKGIPFVGERPAGKLRWKAPVDFTPDDGVYEAYYFGKVPCQAGSVGQIGSLYPQGEDCLHLNVWKADDGKQNKPVMVWIHGGAYEIGGATEPCEEGTNFVHEYRTGDGSVSQPPFKRLAPWQETACNNFPSQPLLNQL